MEFRDQMSARTEVPLSGHISWHGKPDDLRSNVPVLAGILRARAEGVPLGLDEVQAVKALAHEQVFVFALQYAETLVEGEALVAARTGQSSRHLADLRVLLADQRADAEPALRREPETERETRPEPLAPLVLREIGGDAFATVLREVLTDRGVRPDAIDVPVGDFWGWLDRREALPDDVARLRLLDDNAFVQALLTDCRGSVPNPALAHPAVVERWATHSGAAMAVLLDDRSRAVEAKGSSPKTRAGMRRIRALKNAVRAYTRAVAQNMTAQLLLRDLREQTLAIHQERRSGWLIEATAQFVSIDRELAGSVVHASAEHRAVCSEESPSSDCQDCIAAVADRVEASTFETPADFLAGVAAWAETVRATGREPAPAEVDRPLAGPDEDDEHAWWLPTDGGRRVLRWRTALLPFHVDGGWCALPGGPLPEGSDDRRLTLLVEGEGLEPSLRRQKVVLRRRGGEWEISGIRWPEDFGPGVIVTFDWPRGGSVVTARTVKLAQPVVVEGVVFRHEYDQQVVTRELVPGVDQDRAVPDLSDASWVVRTVRRLGYLSPEGVAVLAEHDLVRNCLELGMPRSMAGRLPGAVRKLCDAGVLQHVEGSRDTEDRPWFPARPGQVRVDLLRYVPPVRVVEQDADRALGGHESRRGHEVAGFVRRLPDGAQASDEQIDLHREAAVAAGIVRQPLREGLHLCPAARSGAAAGAELTGQRPAGAVGTAMRSASTRPR
ncbi:hypothetical protein JIG36_25975 [Actinoplanes sp. LDG1-06]|uniref:Uncharacterized protein n=1 Tax=Paractinoplanes ovalisporus TaxID=2810368 RepID=A0ABS2AGU5_9ACTN|nr:hypothetical protein [Actinoplanes ovalisporus]MBM2619010.1 hypothetical protein [Actinoplanes ovalisporus]